MEEESLTKHETDTCLDELLSNLRFGYFHIKVVILTCGAYLAACSEMMLIVFLSKPLKDEWELNDMMFPVLPFCSGIIGFIASFVFGSLSDRIGRQKPLLIAISMLAVFGVASAFAPTFWSFIVLRALVSCGTSGIEAVDFVLLLGMS